MKINEYESYILQALSTTSLFAELHNSNYLNSEHFKNLKFENESFKEILKYSGIGNPASLQMLLYALLVIPKELEEKGAIKLQLSNLNIEIAKLKISLHSTYTEKGVFNYVKHIRNVLSHGNCFFSTINNQDVITFKDCSIRDKNKHCEIVMSTYDVGNILTSIQKILLSYFENKKNN